MLEILDPTKNPVTYAIPFFVLSILVELAALKWLDDEPADLDRRGYERRDARTSMLMGAGSLVSMSVLKVGTFFAYLWVYEHVAPFHALCRCRHSFCYAARLVMPTDRAMSFRALGSAR